MSKQVKEGLYELYHEIWSVLEKDEEARNNDKYLTIQIWKNRAGSDRIDVEQVFSLPDQASIKRMRAVIQNDLKKFIPTRWEVAKQRRWAEDEWQAFLGYLPGMAPSQIEG